MVGTITRRQTSTLTWTVIGTIKPVRLRLVNSDPETLRLQGGNTQTVTTSGGTNNMVSRTATGRRVGNFNVEYTLIGTVNESTVATAAFRRELPRIAAQTKKEARHLPVNRRTIATNDVLILLDHAQQDIATSLPYPELAAFRDAVAATIDELRGEAIEKSIARRRTNRAIVLIREGPPPAPRLPEKEARRLIDRFIDFITPKGTSPLRSICIVTTPESGAVVALYPSSFPTDRSETLSTGTIELYLGRYNYEITRSGFQRATGVVNLLRNPDRVLACTLPRTADEPHVCAPRAPRRDECR